MVVSLLLTPLAFLISWSIFISSSSTMTCLVTLLIVTMGLPLVYVEHLKIFWPCGLFLILMTTGLIVIFAYMVSLHPSEKAKGSKVLYSVYTLTLTLVILNYNLYIPRKVFLPSTGGILVDPVLSLLLILLLLFLVVAFIRIVYSKGGGFRKKF